MSGHETTGVEPADKPMGYPRKRRQTQRRLLSAGMAVLAEQGPGNVSAGQIATAAGVATGTFYNHFSSVDVFIDAVAHDLGRAVEIGTDTLAAIEHDPAVRVSLGVLQLLDMADNDPVSATAFVSLAAVRPEFRARVRALVGQAIADGVDDGCFEVASHQAAINAVLGATLQSMRSRVLGETDHREAKPVAGLVLRLLGVPTRKIERTVDKALRAIAEPAADITAAGSATDGA
ncbi:MAG: TetR/AcrR family transcriptional regulator [Acidimicrobiales bacterium]